MFLKGDKRPLVGIAIVSVAMTVLLLHKVLEMDALKVVDVIV